MPLAYLLTLTVALLSTASLAAEGGTAMTLALVSTSFEANGEIPTRYTCEGEDVSPPLAWSGVPEGSQSLVLIIDDPDAPDPRAPKMTWVHWVLYNLPPDVEGLPEGEIGRAHV